MFDFNYKARCKNIQGMTLIEVMIALVILSVGLLGLAGLQVQGLRGTSGSNSRVQAIFIINDMAERMHANSTELNNNFTYTNVTLDTSDAANICNNAPATDCNASGVNCSPVQLKDHDNFEVCQSMAAGLPFGATMTITCDLDPACVVDTPHTLVLNWFEVQDASLGQRRQQTITLNIQP